VRADGRSTSGCPGRAGNLYKRGGETDESKRGSGSCCTKALFIGQVQDKNGPVLRGRNTESSHPGRAASGGGKEQGMLLS